MNRRISYAGAPKKPKPYTVEERCDRAYLHFRNGNTTLKIAKMMNVSEATALRYITLGRCAARGLETPYR